MVRVVKFPEIGLSCHQLKVLGGQCQDPDKCPGIGQYLDVLWCSKISHSSSNLLVGTPCSLRGAAQLVQREFHVLI